MLPYVLFPISNNTVSSYLCNARKHNILSIFYEELVKYLEFLVKQNLLITQPHIKAGGCNERKLLNLFQKKSSFIFFQGL